MPHLPIRLFFLWTILLSTLFSKGFELRYKVGEKGDEYRFKTKYNVKFTSLDGVQSLEERMSGTFMDTAVKKLENDSFRIARAVQVEEYIHNGDAQPIKDFERTLAGYEYILHPRKGKIRIVGNESFDPNDALEFIVPLPRKQLRVGDSWRKTYYYNLAVGKRRKIPLKGAFKLADIQGNIGRIVGRFRAKIPPDSKLNYEGSIRLDAEYYFHLLDGTFERGRVTTGLLYQSKSVIAKEFFLQSKRKERLGYALQFSSTFERN